jgi:flagellar protein FlaI
MESVLIDIDPEKEEMVPRPEAGEEISDLAGSLLADAREDLFPDYEDRDIEGLESALAAVEPAPEVVAESTDGADVGASSAATFEDGSSEADSAPAPFGDDTSDEPLETDETFVVGEAFTGDGSAGPSDAGATADTGAAEQSDTETAAPTGNDQPAAAASGNGGPGGRDDENVSAVDEPSLDVEADDSGPTDASSTGSDDDGGGSGGFVSATPETGDEPAADADTGVDGGDETREDGADDSWGFGGFTTADPEED